MRHSPLNQTGVFDVWPPLDPGLYIDTNASFVRQGDGRAWSVFCRYAARPEPGRGSIWAVAVDAGMRPCGVPFRLAESGIDPRAIAFGKNIVVVFAVIERNEADQPSGSAMIISEFAVEDGGWTALRAHALPKNPITGQVRPDSAPAWEKNWVPFPVDETRIGLVYSHEPWDVILLDLDPADQPKLEQLFRSPALSWDYGTIRGGTPPVRFDEGHLVTFFHASQAVGSKSLYCVGACVFLEVPPYSPVLQTVEPLLMAPYKGGVRRFGWNFSAGVVFPLGADCVRDVFRLTCGRDDGEIASFDVPAETLRERLTPVRRPGRGAFHDYRGRDSGSLVRGQILYVPEPVPGISELAMIRFLKWFAGTGRTFVDVGAHIGFYTMALAPGFKRVVSYEPSRFQHGWLVYNRNLNGFDHVECRESALGEDPGTLTLNVLSEDGGCNTLSERVAAAATVQERYAVPIERLDDGGLTDVDLLKIDVEGFELPVLRGARATIAASRPAILIEVWVEVERRSEIRAFMASIDYTFEESFPSSPELVLCLPLERRASHNWFI